jgi:hypothetical protein
VKRKMAILGALAALALTRALEAFLCAVRATFAAWRAGINVAIAATTSGTANTDSVGQRRWRPAYTGR